MKIRGVYKGRDWNFIK